MALASLLLLIHAVAEFVFVLLRALVDARTPCAWVPRWRNLSRDTSKDCYYRMAASQARGPHDQNSDQVTLVPARLHYLPLTELARRPSPHEKNMFR